MFNREITEVFWYILQFLPCGMESINNAGMSEELWFCYFCTRHAAVFKIWGSFGFSPYVCQKSKHHSVVVVSEHFKTAWWFSLISSPLGTWRSYCTLGLWDIYRRSYLWQSLKENPPKSIIRYTTCIFCSSSTVELAFLLTASTKRSILDKPQDLNSRALKGVTSGRPAPFVRESRGQI